MNMLRIMASALLCASALTATQVCALEYPLPAANSRLIGEDQEYTVPNDGRPLEAIAAEFQLGLTNMLEANPGVDPYLPKAGSVLKVPHRLILPDAPREGIVINVAEMRLYYFPKGRNIVEVLPIGIGQLGTDTPENWVTSIQSKRANPTWTPTAKVHAEYAAKGEPLPAVVPSGPENPMGLFALYVGRLYAIHGTNASFGIGLRVSHGCVRLRNDDIEHLFKIVPVGTRVQFLNQPVKVTAEPDGGRYMEVHQPLSRSQDEMESTGNAPLALTPAVTRFIAHKDSDSFMVKQTLEQRTGMPERLNP